MSEVNNVKLSMISTSGKTGTCILEYPVRPPWFLTLRNDDIEELSAQNNDLFECLRDIRLVLEKQSWFILCNGARIDAYPSTMSREMSGGRLLYLMRMQQPARHEDLIDIFAPAPYEKIGTVVEQENYYRMWWESCLTDKSKRKTG